MRKFSIILLAVSFLGLGHGVTSAACWELTDKDGQKVLATDIWHIRNRLGQSGFLIGKLDGKDASIPVADINIIRLAPVKKGWIPFMDSHTMKGDITFTDGRTGRFASDQNLHLLKDAKKSSIPLANIRSITRCDAETAAMMAGSEQENTTAPATIQQPIIRKMDSLHLTNGDVLHGSITNTDFSWKAPYTSLTFQREQIQQITLPGNAKESGLIELRSGDRISGNLVDKVIEITLKYGQRVPIAVELLKSARFRTTPP